MRLRVSIGIKTRVSVSAQALRSRQGWAWSRFVPLHSPAFLVEPQPNAAQGPSVTARVSLAYIVGIKPDAHLDP